jgi:hypothetical protein
MTSDYANNTVELYRDVIQRFPNIDRSALEMLELRLVDGYLSQASRALDARDVAGAGAPLARALGVNPKRVAQRGIGAIRNRISRSTARRP